MKRLLSIIVLGMLAVVAVVGAGGAAWLWSVLPKTDGTVEVPVLREPVSVLRDSFGVPHIFANSAADAYFALGYVHAQDRIWQMETTRRLGAGRLAEILGPSALKSDRWMRTLGVYRLAEQQFEKLSDPTREAIERYTAGVNARLRHAMRFPWGVPAPEFAFLRYKPEDWRPADSLVWGKVMAMRLGGNWRDEILRARLARRLSPTQVGQLWPLYPADGPATVDRTAALTRGMRLDRLAAVDPLPPGLPRGASNAWAVAPRITDTRGAILANDPHLGFSAPVVWYLARIEAPDLVVTGATVPGVPFVLLGQTDRVAWGVTSTNGDGQDLFVEQTEADGKRYRAPDGWREFETRNETIAVKGATPVLLKVRETRHGPVISDLDPAIAKAAGPGAVIALMATYQESRDRTPDAVYALNRAKDWDGFLAALREFAAPQSNFVYADKDGNIGFAAPGLIPIRAKGWGLVPSAGWDGETDWTGFVPSGDMLRVFNPPSARVVNANNRIAPPDYPHFIGFDWDPGYRARRIVELIEDNRQTVHSTVRIQQDAVSTMARQLVPLMTSIDPPDPIGQQVRGMLEKWDGTMSRDRPEPLIFSTWLRELNHAIYADELDTLFGDYLTLRPLFVFSVLTKQQAWCDNINTTVTEDCPDRLRFALKRATDKLVAAHGGDPKAWRWGDAHKATFVNGTFSALPWISRFVDLEIETDGGNYTVNRGASRISDPVHPFRHVHGAGYRAVYDLADLRRSRFIIATGQSGNIFSPRYHDQLEAWRDGRHLRLGQSRDVLNNTAPGRLLLAPQVGP